LSPVAAIDAVAREPLATMQALAERMNAPPETPDATATPQTPGADQAPQPAPADTMAHMPPGLAAALAQAAALAPSLASTLAAALPPALHAEHQEALATAQAQQGRMTLGQMAQQSQAAQVQAESAVQPTASTPVNSEATQQSLASPPVATTQSMAAASVLSVPVWMSPLQAPPSPHTQRQAAVQPEPAQQRGQHGGQQDQDAQQEGSEEEPGSRRVPTPDAQAEDPTAAQANGKLGNESGNQAGNESGDQAGAQSSVQAQALLDAVRQHASAEVQRELQAGRRLLVVLPQDQAGRGLVSARAALFGPFGVRFFEAARWWPGDGVAAAAAGDGAVWPQWRVFREGDPLRAPLLVSRADGHACRVLLGTPAPQVLDSHAATLELPERLRFVQALGGQWSLLLVVAPVQAGAAQGH
jgi:hypothetical protein